MDNSVQGLVPPAVVKKGILALFAASREGMIVADSQWRVLAANEAAKQITGYTEAEMQGRLPPFLDIRRALPETSDALRLRVRLEGHWAGELRSRRKDGTPYPLHTSITTLPSGGVAMVFSDITERKRVEGVLTALAFFDPLTGLPNRSLFVDRLGHAMAHAGRAGGRVALLVVDLDGFKAINDSLGHGAGDRLLKAVAVRLRQGVRDTDTVARLSGDEFAVVLETVAERGHAEAVARKIGDAIAAPFILDERHCRVGASIGVALFPDDAVTPQYLLACADAAMYQAKRDGRGGGIRGEERRN